MADWPPFTFFPFPFPLLTAACATVAGGGGMEALRWLLMAAMGFDLNIGCWMTCCSRAVSFSLQPHKGGETFEF